MKVYKIFCAPQYFQLLSLCFRYWCVCVFILFFSNICLSYLVWLKILIVELLLPIGRHLIKTDHTAGCLASLQRKLPFNSSPSLGRNPTSLSNYFFIYLTEKLHLEHGRHNKRKRKNRVMRSRSVGIQDQQGKKSIAERFLSKDFFFTLSLCLFLSHKLPNITSKTCTRQSLPEGES